jgi:hypothetical protein
VYACWGLREKKNRYFFRNVETCEKFIEKCENPQQHQFCENLEVPIPEKPLKV